MEQEDSLPKRSSTHTEHEYVSEDEISGTSWDGNAKNDESNVPTGPVTHSMNKGWNVTAKGFVTMSQGVNCLSNCWKNVSSWFGRSKTSNIMNLLHLLKIYENTYISIHIFT